MFNLHPDILKLERPKPDGLWKFHKDIRRVIRTGAGFRMVKDTPKTAAKKAVSESNNEGKLEPLTSFTPLLPLIENEGLR